MLLRHPSVHGNVLSYLETYYFWKLIIILYHFFGMGSVRRWHITPCNIAELFSLLDMFTFRKLQRHWARCQNNPTTLSIFPCDSCVLKIGFCITWFQEILKEQSFSATSLDIFFFKWVSKLLIVVAGVLLSCHCRKSQKTHLFSLTTYASRNKAI